MEVFKVVVSFINFDELSEEEVVQEIENARFPNDCLSLRVEEYQKANVDWTDDHPLNKHATRDQAFKELWE